MFLNQKVFEQFYKVIGYKILSKIINIIGKYNKQNLINLLVNKINYFQIHI